VIRIVALVLALLVLGVGGLVAYASTKPDSFRVQRSATIQAPPARVQPHISGLKAWTAWSPYEKKDPAMKRSFSGPGSGKGAVYEWSGNKEVGRGRMEIIESTPAKVVFKLDFYEPFEGHNTAEFTLAEKAGATEVTWAIHGPAPLITKVMSTLCDMDKMIGDDFAAGLASLKSIVEK
jgi:hypothetical protein